jgi:uncharacterized membrane protein
LQFRCRGSRRESAVAQLFSLGIITLMTQDDINRSEWSNPKNWSALIYHSRIDSRMIVPKRTRLGWTINFGNKNGVMLFVALLALLLVVFIALYFSGVHFGRH